VVGRIGGVVGGVKYIQTKPDLFQTPKISWTESENQKRHGIIREILEKEPPNDRARFFDFDVDQGGLKVNVL